MKKHGFNRKTGLLIWSAIVLLFLMVTPGTAIAASNVGDIEYGDNSLTPTEQQEWNIIGNPPNGGGWDWGDIWDFLTGIGESIVEILGDVWNAFTSFLSDIGEMIRNLWDSLPDWVQDLIITIAAIVAFIVVAVVLVVLGVVSVIVAVIAVVVAAIAGIVYFAMYGGTEDFNGWHALAWVFGAGAAAGGLAYLASIGALTPIITAIGNGLRFLGGRIAMGARGVWQFVVVEGLIPEFHAFMTLMRMFGAWMSRKFATGLLTASLYRFAHGGTMGLIRHLFTIGLKGAGVGIGFDLFMSWMTGESLSWQSLIASGVTGFLGAITGIGLWTRFREASRFGKFLWAGFGAGMGGILEVINSLINGNGFSWKGLLVGSLVWGAMGPLNNLLDKLGISGMLVDFMKSVPGKVISQIIKDIVYWNDPEIHSNNMIKNYFNALRIEFYNFRMEAYAWFRRVTGYWGP